VTTRYPDGQTLSLLVVDDKFVEKSMTFGLEWDFEEIKEQKEKGAEVIASSIGKKAVWN
jgi:hypothetical protein